MRWTQAQIRGEFHWAGTIKTEGLNDRTCLITGERRDDEDNEPVVVLRATAKICTAERTMKVKTERGSWRTAKRVTAETEVQGNSDTEWNGFGLRLTESDVN